MVLLLTGCITNNSYTATGKSKQVTNKEKKYQFKRNLEIDGHTIGTKVENKSSKDNID